MHNNLLMGKTPPSNVKSPNDAKNFVEDQRFNLSDCLQSAKSVYLI